MSLLGKKRPTRSEEDDKEFEQLAGIKEEEPKEENKEINNEANKVENSEIKIIENTINISTNERIKNTTVKKESKSKNIKIEVCEQKKLVIPKDKNVTEEKKDNNKEVKDNKKETSLFSFNINKENEGKKENNNQTSLFGNLINTNQSLFSNKDNSTSLFGIPLNKEKDNDQNKSNNQDNNNTNKKESKETNQGSNSLFGKNTLFSNNEGKSLFGNNSANNTSLFFGGLNVAKNPFSDIKGDNFIKNLIDNKKENNNKNDEKDNTLFEGGDLDSDKSDEGDKPKTKYLAEPLKAQDYSEYSKLFNLNINNLFLYNKLNKKFVSKGSGFFSIEKTKDDKSEKHQAVVVFRNHAGNKLVEGFLDSNFKNLDIINKEFNYVACFGIVMMNEGKPDLGLIKIPFKIEENANNLKKAFEKAMEFIGKK